MTGPIAAVITIQTSDDTWTRDDASVECKSFIRLGGAHHGCSVESQSIPGGQRIAERKGFTRPTTGNVTVAPATSNRLPAVNGGNLSPESESLESPPHASYQWT